MWLKQDLFIYLQDKMQYIININNIHSNKKLLNRINNKPTAWAKHRLKGKEQKGLAAKKCIDHLLRHSSQECHSS